jgi:DNA-binding NarL/FixJ family response regulator
VDTVKVLVAGKNRLVNDGICAILKTQKSIDVVGVVTSIDSIVEAMKKKIPDVLLIDIAMTHSDDASVIRSIRNENDSIKVLLISENEDRDCILGGIKAGCNGYLPKRASSSDLVTAILAVHGGGYFLFPSIAKTMVSEYLRIKQGQNPEPYDRLSDREKEVLRLLAEGYKAQQIAELLNITLKTVIGHKTRIMAKLHIHNRTELIKYAIRKHLIII